MQAEKAKATDRLSRWFVQPLHQLMDVLDLPRGTGKKVMAYLYIYIYMNFLACNLVHVCI